MNTRAREPGLSEEGVTVGRIMSFSDGIFAVAITLLILNIDIPAIPKDQVSRELGPALRGLAPHFRSFVISFLVIGVYWMAHHGVFRHIRRSDRTFLWANLLFMMSIVLLPFSTNLLSAYGEDRLAVMFYAGNLTMTGSLMALMWWYASRGIVWWIGGTPPRKPPDRRHPLSVNSPSSSCAVCGEGCSPGLLHRRPRPPRRA